MPLTLRIQRGRFRGQKLKMPPPVRGELNLTPALLKEAAFQILENRIADPGNCAFFDLCAGSGQMAIEALSLGYNPVHLAEIDNKRFGFILENTAPFRKEIQMHRKDFRRMAPIILSYPVSALFLDPPYSFWESSACSAIDSLLTHLHEHYNGRNSDEDIPRAGPPHSRVILLIQGREPYSVPPDIHAIYESRAYRKQHLTIAELNFGI